MVPIFLSSQMIPSLKYFRWYLKNNQRQQPYDKKELERKK